MKKKIFGFILITLILILAIMNPFGSNNVGNKKSAQSTVDEVATVNNKQTDIVQVNVNINLKGAVSIHLLANGIKIKSVTTDEAVYTFENLDLYDENGKEINYSIEVDGIERNVNPNISPAQMLSSCTDDNNEEKCIVTYMYKVSY